MTGDMVILQDMLSQNSYAEVIINNAEPLLLVPFIVELLLKSGALANVRNKQGMKILSSD